MGELLLVSAVDVDSDTENNKTSNAKVIERTTAAEELIEDSSE